MLVQEKYLVGKVKVVFWRFLLLESGVHEVWIIYLELEELCEGVFVIIVQLIRESFYNNCHMVRVWMLSVFICDRLRLVTVTQLALWQFELRSPLLHLLDVSPHQLTKSLIAAIFAPKCAFTLKP